MQIKSIQKVMYKLTPFETKISHGLHLSLLNYKKEKRKKKGCQQQQQQQQLNVFILHSQTMKN